MSKRDRQAKSEEEETKALREEADAAEEEANLDGYDFSIPKSKGALSRVATELYNILWAAMMAGYHSEGSRRTDEVEHLRQQKAVNSQRKVAAALMKDWPKARKRMEEMCKEADEADEKAGRRP